MPRLQEIKLTYEVSLHSVDGDDPVTDCRQLALCDGAVPGEDGFPLHEHLSSQVVLDGSDLVLRWDAASSTLLMDLRVTSSRGLTASNRRAIIEYVAEESKWRDYLDWDLPEELADHFVIVAFVPKELAKKPAHSWAVTLDAELFPPSPQSTGLALCDGLQPLAVRAALESESFASNFRLVDSSVTLAFDPKASTLSAVVTVTASRAFSAKTREELVAFLESPASDRWRTGLGWKLPPALEGSEIRIGRHVREVIEIPMLDAVRELAAKWPSASAEAVDALPDSERESLRKRLSGVYQRLSLLPPNHELECVRELYAIVASSGTRRAAKALDIPTISVDDLDKLDDLPPDVF